MSVRVEWETANVPVRLVGPGQEMPDGGRNVGGWTLVIGGGSGAFLVIEGAPEELVGFAQRVVSAVSALDASSPRHTRVVDRPWRLTVKGLLAIPPPTASQPPSRRSLAETRNGMKSSSPPSKWRTIER